MTEIEFHGDEALRIIWHGIVEEPTAIPTDRRPTEGDVVRREDAVFGHGSLHQLVLAGPDDCDRLAVSFVAYRDGDRLVVWARWEDPGDHGLGFELAKAVMESADPLEGGNPA